MGESPDKDQSYGKISPSEIKQASSLLGEPSFTFLTGEEEAIDHIEKIQHRKLIDNPKKYQVIELLSKNENYSVRDIAKKTGYSKSSVQRIKKAYKK